jgi:hypothetical protein
MYVCMYVCMFVCMYVCMYLMYVCMCMYLMYVCMFVCMYVCVCMYVSYVCMLCMYVYVCNTHTYIYIHAYIHNIHTYIHMYACMYVCIAVCSYHFGASKQVWLCMVAWSRVGAKFTAARSREGQVAPWISDNSWLAQVYICDNVAAEHSMQYSHVRLAGDSRSHCCAK